MAVQRRGDVEMLAVFHEAQQLEDRDELSCSTARAVEQVGEGRMYGKFARLRDARKG